MNKNLQLIFSFLVLLVLTGCMVGPNYRAPKVKVPEAFSHGNTTPAVPEEMSKWWTTLQDPQLNSLIDRAVRQNLELQIAQARVREARALRGVEKADLLPTVNAAGSYQRIRTSENTVSGGDSTSFPNFEGNLYNVGFDASWEIDLFGGVRRRIEAANAEVAAEIENRRQVLVSLLAEVGRNYVELRTSQTRAAIARANLSAQQETLEITRIRLEAGLISDLDVARAEAQVQNTASQIPLLEAASRQSMHALSVLLGSEPNALVAELGAGSQLPASPAAVPAALPSDLLRIRPDVRRAERQLAAATARIGVATADLFPKFSLTAALGLQSASVGDLTDSGSTFWSFIPGVRWPVFDFGRIRNNIGVQNAREEQAFLTYEQTVLTSLREVEDAIVSFSEDQKRRQTLAGSVEANRRAVQLANDLYRNGLTDFLSVLQAQRDLFESEDSLATSEQAVLADFIALYKSLGGGWQIESAAQTDSVPGKPGDRAIDVTMQK